MSEAETLERIRQLVRAADQMALDQYGRSPGSLKPDGSWVTPADGAIEDFLRRELTALFHGDVGIFGEEQGWSENRSASYIAILDPIDGTAAFRSRIPVWGVSLAVFQQQAEADLWEPLIGIFSMPAANHVFLSAHGKRAEWNAALLTIPPVQPDIGNPTISGSHRTCSTGISVNIPASFGASASPATRSFWSPPAPSRPACSPVSTFTILPLRQWCYGRPGEGCIDSPASR